MKFFTKANTNNRIVTNSGAVIVFEDIGNGSGVIATEDSEIIAALDKRSKAKVAGVREVTAEKAAELKKKAVSTVRSSQKQRGALPSNARIDRPAHITDQKSGTPKAAAVPGETVPKYPAKAPPSPVIDPKPVTATPPPSFSPNG